MNPNSFYHIYNHANGDENLFRNNENYSFFLRKFAFYIEPIADTYAYCLMPNHFHFLIRTKDEEELKKLIKDGKKPLEGLKPSKGSNYHKDDTENIELEKILYLKFSHLFNSYAQAYNKMYKRRGGLFIHPFKKKEVNNDSYFITLVHYIHANPVHHGFVKAIEDWTYSSYLAFLSNQKTLVKRDNVLELFNGKADFIKYHQQPIDPKIELRFD